MKRNRGASAAPTLKQVLLIFSLFLPLLTLCGREGEAKPARRVSGKDMAVDEFLRIVRYPRFLNWWAKLEGAVVHKAGGKKLKLPIELRARFQKTGWKMRVILNHSESYLVRQVPEDGLFGTTVIQQAPAKEGEKSLRDLMIRPGDITLSFLYWDFDQELKPKTVKTVACRVLELKHEAAKEFVRAWISTKYFFPIRVHWFKAGAAKPYRRLDFKGMHKLRSSADKKQTIMMVKEVVISNPGWKTQVKFGKFRGDQVTPQAPAPKDLFGPGSKDN